MKDYYKILNIDKNASKDEIKKSYRKLSKQYHPDVNPNGEQMFKDITEAYEVLSNDNKRREYDNPRPSFSDFFNQFNRQNVRRNVPRKKVVLNVTISDIYFGRKKDMTYQVGSPCNSCGGNGGESKVCDNCGGSGHIQKTFGSGFFRHVSTQQCNVCAGSGRITINPCYDCGGEGTKFKYENLTITVPYDAENGRGILIKEKGDYYKGIGRGHLEVMFNIKDEGGFKKEGNDMIYDKFLEPLDFITNTPIVIPHPDGDIKVNMPVNHKTDKPLRIKGKGFRYNGVGNLYVRIYLDNKPLSIEDANIILKEISNQTID